MTHICIPHHHQLTMKFQQILSGLTFILLMAMYSSCSIGQKRLLKNEYGLTVISKIRWCKCTSKTDTVNQLVRLSSTFDTLITDWKYATTDNFTYSVLYNKPEAFVRYPLVSALTSISEELKINGLRFKFFDTYRPYSITKTMWKIIPDERYAANPSKASNHNRAAAVDVTLVDINTGRELAMPTLFDDFTERAHHNYPHLPENVITNRDYLRKIMEKHGFIALENEWWHYSWPDAAKKFDILDIPFSVLRKYIK